MATYIPDDTGVFGNLRMGTVAVKNRIFLQDIMPMVTLMQGELNPIIKDKMFQWTTEITCSIKYHFNTDIKAISIWTCFSKFT